MKRTLIPFLRNASAAGICSLVLFSAEAQAQTTVAAAGTTAAVPPVAAIAAAGAKKPKSMKIGLVMPKSQLGQSPTAGEPLRSMLAQYLAGPYTEIVLITALLPQQIDAEAQSKSCDYLVYTDLTQKKSQGGMGLLKGAGTFSNMIPMIGAANGIRSIVATTMAANAAEQVASLSSGLKAKTEVTLGYHLTTVGTPAPVSDSSFTAKTAVDGQDVITPLVEQEATAILNSVARKS